MPLSKEKMKEYQAARRAKKKGEVSAFPESQTVRGSYGIPVNVVNPAILKMFHDIERDLMGLEDRVTALESRKAVEPVVREVFSKPRGRTEAIGKQSSSPKEDSVDLFKRVMASKEARLKG